MTEPAAPTGDPPALRRRCGWKAPSAALRARIDVRAERPHRRQRRRHLAGEPERHARFARRPDRGAACGMGGFRDPTRFVAIAFGAGDHPRARRDRAPRRLSHRATVSPRAACGGGRVSVRPSAPPSLRFLGRGDAVLAGLAGMGGRSNTRMSPSRSLSGRSGQGLPPTRSRSSRPRRDLRSTGARSPPGGGAAFSSPRSRMPPGSPRREIRRSTCGFPSTSPTASRGAPAAIGGRGRTTTHRRRRDDRRSALESAADVQGRR